MKKSIIECMVLFLMMFPANNMHAQDIIILKNGDEIKSKIQEVSIDQVKYKKWENLDGPNYASLKSEIFMIKYQNGTKDVFNIQTTTNSENSAASKDEIKKNEAVKKLEVYIKNKIKGPVISFTGFKKTNGKLQDNFAGKAYIIYCNVDILFNSDGWKVGNDFEGYWSNFYVYPSRPDLSNSIDYYSSGTKFYAKGTFLTFGCEATMSETDNGYEIESFSIKTVTNHGKDNPATAAYSNIGSKANDVVIGNNGANKSSTGNILKNSDYEDISLPNTHRGHFFVECKTSDALDKRSYLCFHQLKKDQVSVNRNIFYRTNEYSLHSAKFGKIDKYSGDTLLVNHNDTLSLIIDIEGFKSTKHKKIKITGSCEYIISVQIEDNMGKEYLIESYETLIILGAPAISSIEDFSGKIPIEIIPEKVNTLPLSQPLFLSFLIQEKEAKSSCVEGFIQFEVK